MSPAADDRRSWPQRLRDRAQYWDRGRLIAAIGIVLLVVVFAVITRSVDQGPTTDSERATRNILEAVRDGDCEELRDLTDDPRLFTQGPTSFALVQCGGYFFANDAIDIYEIRSDHDDDEAQVPRASGSILIDGDLFYWSFEYRRTQEGLRLQSIVSYGNDRPDD